MSCSQVKSWVKELTWLLIGPLFSGSQSGARLKLFDPTLDIDYNSKVSIPVVEQVERGGGREQRQGHAGGAGVGH